MRNRPKVIAFNLPQFHPIPENDEWWGKGFTEWTNVAKAKPLFRGHHQPNVPADLGFYDLRLPEAREMQADYARKAGVYGFCYWHYWFGNSRRLLERPVDEIRATDKPDFPYMLGWGNQTWTGIWHGAKDRVLIDQKYPGAEDVYKHCQLLIKFFDDTRYIRVNDRPLFYIYDPGSTGFTRNYLELYKETFITKFGISPIIILKDVGLPKNHWGNLADAYTNEPLDLMRSAGVDFSNKLRRKIISTHNKSISRANFNEFFKLNNLLVIDYLKAINSLNCDRYDSDHIPCILPNWDNTPRSGYDGWVAKNATPETFDIHLRNIFSSQRSGDFENYYFLKSWNEWAEGNYIEPDLRNGMKYIETLRNNIDIFSHP
jgi:hypothetical protein